MAAAKTIYRPLTRTSSSLTSYHRLYAGPDHLLQVNSTGFTESYKRFHYHDIQALFIVRNSQRQWTAVISGSMMFLLALPGVALLATREVVGGAVFLTLAALAATALVVNFALGPTCTCLIRTAVQIDRLASVKRVRTAEKVLARLRPLIAQAQGELAAEELERLWRNRAATRAKPADSPGLPPVIDPAPIEGLVLPPGH